MLEGSGGAEPPTENKSSKVCPSPAGLPALEFGQVGQVAPLTLGLVGMEACHDTCAGVGGLGGKPQYIQGCKLHYLCQGWGLRQISRSTLELGRG